MSLLSRATILPPGFAVAALLGAASAADRSPEDPSSAVDSAASGRVAHAFSDHDGVRLHYVTAGDEGGPLVVMIHGFPDFWFSWRHQIDALAADFRIAAVDLRGYNRSDQPPGDDAYAMPVLVGDVAAVLDDLDAEKAVICGHDWGGAIAWSFAMAHPERTERLIILNLPHPRGFLRELTHNPDQQAASAYARRFQEDGAHESLTAESLAALVAGKAPDPVRKRYLEAFRRSDFEAMLRYYRRNFPRPPYHEPPADAYPAVRCPTLVIHGLDDPALLAAGLDRTWEWIENELTLVAVPGAGHWVHHDAPAAVNRALLRWLRP